MQAQYQKQETKIRDLEEKIKEQEFLNTMLSDRLTLTQRKQFGASSEKYADSYVQRTFFNKAEQEVDPDAQEPNMEEIHPFSYKKGNIPAKRKMIFPPLRRQKWSNISSLERTGTAQTVSPNISLSQKKP